MMDRNQDWTALAADWQRQDTPAIDILQDDPEPRRAQAAPAPDGRDAG